MSLAPFLSLNALRNPDCPAIILGSEVCQTYASLEDRVARLATSLRRKLGCHKGDRIGLLMKNHPAYVEVMLACWWGGLVPVPINPKLHWREAEYILNDSGARLCFVAGAPGPDAFSNMPTQIIDADSESYADLFSAPPQSAADTRGTDLAWLFYTSGTTGRPKGACLSHQNLLAMSDGYIRHIDMPGTADQWLHAAPMSHGSGLYAIPTLMRGGAQVIPQSGGFDVSEIWRLIAAHDRISMFLVPTMVQRLIADAKTDDVNIAHLKTIIYGGAPMPIPDLIHALKTLGPKFVQIYGQGETPMTISVLSHDDHTRFAAAGNDKGLASVGRLQDSISVELRNSKGEQVAQGEAGEICVHGPSVMLGYWNNPEATKETLKEGWLATGDIGVFDSEGYLTLKDRAKDMIISGGSNIYPREVEQALEDLDEIDAVSVVGAPHSEWGEIVVAFVVASNGQRLTASFLDTHCLASIARFKRPRRYVFLNELPKNATGKIDKQALRRQLTD